jgi:hypothetical protein
MALDKFQDVPTLSFHADPAIVFSHCRPRGATPNFLNLNGNDAAC